PLDKEQNEFAATVRDSAISLLAIINDILDFAQLDAGKLILNVAPFNVRQTILEITSLLEPQAFAKGLDLTLDYAANAPVTLMGDVARFRQILINLVGNAVKFTERGVISVGVRCQRRTAGEATLELIVRDTGIGIPADKLELVFEKFTQADGSMSRRYGGTGIGLSIVKQLVDMMGGSVRVESRVGVGTTFTVDLSLPIAEKPR